MLMGRAHSWHSIAPEINDKPFIGSFHLIWFRIQWVGAGTHHCIHWCRRITFFPGSIWLSCKFINCHSHSLGPNEWPWIPDPMCHTLEIIMISLWRWVWAQKLPTADSMYRNDCQFVHHSVPVRVISYCVASPGKWQITNANEIHGITTHITWEWQRISANFFLPIPSPAPPLSPIGRNELNDDRGGMRGAQHTHSHMRRNIVLCCRSHNGYAVTHVIYHFLMLNTHSRARERELETTRAIHTKAFSTFCYGLVQHMFGRHIVSLSHIIHCCSARKTFLLFVLGPHAMIILFVNGMNN